MSDKRNNLPHNGVYSYYLVLYLLRFFLSRIKFTIYLFSSAKSVRGMFPSGLQPTNCVEVSFQSSLDTSNKSEQFAGRSGIQEKVIGSPRIIEKEWKIES